MYMLPNIPGFERGRSWVPTLDMDESRYLRATFSQTSIFDNTWHLDRAMSQLRT